MTLLGALILAGDPRWPQARFHAVAALAILGGLAYTIFSEWLNTEIRGSWAYTDAMPQLPLVGSGLSPLAQWIVVPLIAFWRSEEHTSELQSLMRISYAVFCLKKKKHHQKINTSNTEI